MWYLLPFSNSIVVGRQGHQQHRLACLGKSWTVRSGCVLLLPLALLDPSWLHYYMQVAGEWISLRLGGMPTIRNGHHDWHTYHSSTVRLVAPPPVSSGLLVHSSLASLARAIVLVPSVYLTRAHRKAPVCFHQPSREKVSASILWGMAGAAGDHPWRGLVPRYHAPLVAPAWVRVQNVAPVVVDGWVGGAFPGRALGGRSRRFIHATGLIGWGRRGLGSCRSTCIAHRSSCCRLCGTWTVHDCTTASRRTQTRGALAREQEEIGEHRQSLVFPGSGRSTLSHCFLLPLLQSVLVPDHVFCLFFSRRLSSPRGPKGRTSQ